MKKYLFILFILPLMWVGCDQYNCSGHDKPDIDLMYYYLIVEFADTNYVDHVLAYETDVTPTEPDYQFKKLAVNYYSYPKGFWEKPYTPWTKLMDNFYVATPFDVLCWPLDAICMSYAPERLQASYLFSKLCALSFKWTDIDKSNYTYGYETVKEDLGFKEYISDVQWPMDSLMVRNPISNIYHVLGEEINQYDMLDLGNREYYPTSMQQMLLKIKEQGNLEEWLQLHKVASTDQQTN